METDRKTDKLTIIKIIKNPFLIIGIVFVLWISFFDSYSLLEHRSINKEIDKLEERKAYFENEITNDRKAIKGLKSGDAIEKYARETYYMKRVDEDIFIIEYDSILKP